MVRHKKADERGGVHSRQGERWKEANAATACPVLALLASGIGSQGEILGRQD